MILCEGLDPCDDISKDIENWIKKNEVSTKTNQIPKNSERT